MVSPISVGTAAIVVAPINASRAIIRFQNIGNKDIYIKKIPLSGSYTVVSSSDYEVLLSATTGPSATTLFSTDSIASFMAISSTPGSTLAIYETIKS